MGKIKNYRAVPDPFFIESVEEGTNQDELRYLGRGEKKYGIGRQLLVRSCHDALVSCNDGEGRRGILLVKRDAEPAQNYLWSLGGFFDRGVSSERSLSSRIKNESGLEVDEGSYVILGHIRAMWNTSPYQKTTVSRGISELMARSNLSLKDLMTLAKRQGLVGEIESMTLEALANLVQERDLPGGIDDTGILFYARGHGKLNLDKLHNAPRIITPREYTSELRNSLHPYIREGMDRAIKLVDL
jgi:ADP-ribose pyrophosphatase YjhB (NUDIX family)